ncbi:MAG TPA: FtsL-like putative cell division protein [Saprospiraceae bacterium]|nr:FtsL-like putative cell division protein [Saprospiraceae bacterium]
MIKTNVILGKLMNRFKFQPDQILIHTKFLLFVFSLVMVNIAVGYYTNDKITQIQTMEKEIKDLRWQYISIESSMLSEAKESQISERVASLKLEVSKDVPKTIVIP